MHKRKSEQKQLSQRTKKLLAAVILGIAAGYVCPYLPEPLQLPCNIGLKLLGIVTGG